MHYQDSKPGRGGCKFYFGQTEDDCLVKTKRGNVPVVLVQGVQQGSINLQKTTGK